MNFLTIITELSRLLWLMFSICVLLQFSTSINFSAEELTVPYVLAYFIVAIEVILAAIFAPDWFSKFFAAMGMFPHAEKLMKNAVSMWEQLAGKNGFLTTAKKAHLAELYLIAGKKTESKEIFEEIIQSWKHHWWTIFSPACKSLSNYAYCLQSDGNIERAREVRVLLRGWQIGAVLPTSVVVAVVALASCYLLYVKQLNSDIATISGKQDSLDIQTTPDTARNVRELVDELASFQNRILGPTAPAGVYLEKAREAYYPIETRNIEQTEWAATNAVKYARQRPASNLQLARALLLLGEINSIKGDLDKAEPMLKEAAYIFSTSEQNDTSYLSALMGLAKVYQIKKEYALSTELYKKAAAKAVDTYGQDSTDAADAFLEQAVSQAHTDKSSNLLETINKAVDSSKKIYEEQLKAQIESKETYRRLMTALVLKRDFLRNSAKEAEADKVDAEMNKIQTAKLRNFKLDGPMQEGIVSNVQSLSKYLLAIKYNSGDTKAARTELGKMLTDSARQTVDFLPGNQEESDESSSKNKLDTSFEDINVESPDPSGLLTVKVRGNARVAKDEEWTPFGFYYRLKFKDSSSKNVLVYRVAELVQGP